MYSRDSYSEHKFSFYPFHIILLLISLFLSLSLTHTHTQRFIQTDIHGYKPSPGDLAYPEKLVVAVSAFLPGVPPWDSFPCSFFAIG